MARRRHDRPRRWRYDAGADKYELLPQQLANLDHGIAASTARGAKTRALIAAELSHGRTPTAIMASLGLSRSTVYRHLIALGHTVRLENDPLMS